MDGASEVALSGPAERRRRGSSFHALFLLVLLAALAVILPSDRRVPTDDPAPPAARPVPTPTGPTLFPTSDLIYRVPAKFRAGCVPFNTGDFPYETLDCTEGLTRALYTRYNDVAGMEAFFDTLIAALNLPLQAGGCRAGVPSQGVWHYTHSPTRPEGRMACFLMPPEGVPVTVVTQPEQRLVAMVVSNPSVGWQEHFEAWSVRVPNPPPDRQRPAREPNVASAP